VHLDLQTMYNLNCLGMFRFRNIGLATIFDTCMNDFFIVLSLTFKVLIHLISHRSYLFSIIILVSQLRTNRSLKNLDMRELPEKIHLFRKYSENVSTNLIPSL